MTNYARIESRTAYLSTDFGEEIARKWFGNESVDSLPRYTRGPRKGKIKGVVSWSKVVRGGWVSGGRETANGGYTGYVENRVGHIFERKLHKLVSTRFETFAGEVIRDLDREEAIAQIKKNRVARADEEIRKSDMERTCLEQIILSGEFDQHNKVFQKMIQERNEDIAALVADM